MQIATWNVNSLKVRLPQVLEWLSHTNCDVLALQELKQENINFPVEAFSLLGYHCIFNGQKTYNGVAIITKYPVTDVIYDMPNYVDANKRVISATINGMRIICVYVVNGESIQSDKFNYKQIWLQALYNYVQQSLQQVSQVVVLGDFNIAPQDLDVYNPALFTEQVLCSTVERNLWHQLLDLGLHDSFRMLNPHLQQYSWWDYRRGSFQKQLGLRIDHILVSDTLKSRLLGCNIDATPRSHERPSDHTPVILTVQDN